MVISMCFEVYVTYVRPHSLYSPDVVDFLAASSCTVPPCVCCECVLSVCWISTGLPAVLGVVLWLLWQGEENWQCRVPVAPRLLLGWDGCLCLQFHHSVKKVCS